MQVTICEYLKLNGVVSSLLIPLQIHWSVAKFLPPPMVMVMWTGHISEKHSPCNELNFSPMPGSDCL